MSKILHRLLVVFACVIGLLVQPCFADTIDLSNYVTLSLLQRWNRTRISVSPGTLYMKKTPDYEMFYFNSDLTELIPFERFYEIPYIRLYKFTGFYTSANGTGIQVIDGSGQIADKQELFQLLLTVTKPTKIVQPNSELLIDGDEHSSEILSEDTQSIVLYPNFEALSVITLFPNNGKTNEYIFYYSSGDECDVWEDEEMQSPIGENYTFSRLPVNDGYVFEGYYDEPTGGVKWIDANGSFAVGWRMICESRENVTRLYARWGQCKVGQYLQGESCQDCPNYDGKIGDDKLYKFVPGTGSGSASCAVKLNVSKSKCPENTNVLFVYNPDTGQYEKSIVAIGEGAGVYITKKDDVFNPDVDYCGACDIGGGKYVDENNVCHDCPVGEDDGCDNCVDGVIGDLYNFTMGSGIGVSSCALKLNSTKCGKDTEVIYTYNATRTKYIRKPGYFVQEGVAPVLAGTNSPKEYELKDYCENPCAVGEYYVNGECAYCNNGYYVDNNKCVKCPAGYACPETGDNLNTPSLCPEKEFSEEGSAVCTKCAPGYTTKYSGPTGAYEYDGLCLKIGYGCISAKACKPLMDATLCYNPDCSSKDSFGLGAVKILSTNQSVVHEMKKSVF